MAQAVRLLVRAQFLDHEDPGCGILYSDVTLILNTWVIEPNKGYQGCLIMVLVYRSWRALACVYNIASRGGTKASLCVTCTLVYKFDFPRLKYSALLRCTVARVKGVHSRTCCGRR